MKLIVKGILLYTTVLSVMLWLSGIDSLMNNDLFFESTGSVAALCALSYFLLDKEDIKILTFSKYLKD